MLYISQGSHVVFSIPTVLYEYAVSSACGSSSIALDLALLHESVDPTVSVYPIELSLELLDLLQG